MDKIKVHTDKLVIKVINQLQGYVRAGTDAFGDTYIPHHKQTQHSAIFLAANALSLIYMHSFLFTINYLPISTPNPIYLHSHLRGINHGRINLPHHAISIRTIRRKQRRHPIQPSQTRSRFRSPIPSRLPHPLPPQRRMDARQRPTKLPRIPTRRSSARSRRGNGIQMPSSSCYDGYSGTGDT